MLFCKKKQTECFSLIELLKLIVFCNTTPTTAAYELIGDLALTRLNSQPIPEPNSAIGILAFGALGVGI